jgi:hypothetical protein
MVLVKFVEHDDAEWHTVKSMKEDLSKGYFNLLMKNIGK